MIINHNIAALNTHRQLSMGTSASSKNMEKLSSGLKINRAGDDAAGLAISEKMRAQIRGLDMASKNSQDGISLIQTAEGALNETHAILQRMRELAVQAGNDTNNTQDRSEIQKEINQLTSEINRIANTSEFNTQKLLDGSKGTGQVKTIQAGKEEVIEDLGVYEITFDINTDVIIDGVKINTGADLAAFKANIAASALDGKYTVEDGTAGALKLTQIADNGSPTAPQVSGAVLTETTPGKAGAAEVMGKFELDITAGKDALIDGVMFAKDSWNTVSDLALKINGDIALSAKYTASVDTSGKLVLEQIAASDEVPTFAQDKSVTLQIGANENQSMSIDINDMRAATLGITAKAGTDGFTESNEVTDGTNNTNVEAGLSVANADDAAAAVTKIQAAIDKVSSERSKLGAFQNRLEHTINNLGTSSENLTAAESRIRDVDMAKEMMEFTKNNILTQASQAMLAQANQQPQGVLQLLR